MGLFSGLGKMVGAVAGLVTGGSGLSGDAAGTSQMVNNGIDVGDLVALLPVAGTDGQKFIVLGKLAAGDELGEVMAAAEQSSGGSSGGSIGLASLASAIGGSYE